jgi:hypothetical protein
MLKSVFSFIVFLILFQPPSMEDHYNNREWNILLNDVRMRYRFSVEFNAFVQVPRFGNTIRELDGKEIVLQGFFLPADVTGDAFVLSHVPMQMCFFCAGAGIESVVELRSMVTHRMRFRRLSTDDFIEVKGRLRLNQDNLDHLIYIMEDAELIKVIR